MTAALLVLLPYTSRAADSKKPVTPYGDYCPRYSIYGKGKSVHSSEQAEEALRLYYREKGFDIEIASYQGRFLKVHIKKNGSIADTILFDTHTGRIRSIY